MKTITMTAKDGRTYTFKQVENKNGSALRLECRKVGDESGKPPYIVTYNPNAYGDSEHVGWSCGCKGWCMKRGPVRKCVHLTTIAEQMAGLKDAA